jgi:hypothetical protein
VSRWPCTQAQGKPDAGHGASAGVAQGWAGGAVAKHSASTCGRKRKSIYPTRQDGISAHASLL